jgi:hypothetical protein
MTKTLPTDDIRNELTQSAFFRRGPEEHQQASTPPPVPPVRGVPPVPPVRGTPSPRRVMKQRHPFDIYQDQYESLQQLALEERKQGGVGSMSAMVREALDSLIAARKRTRKRGYRFYSTSAL